MANLVETGGIKLVASDVDGTLIKAMSGHMYPEMIEEIKYLTDNGVRFVVATGRQYGSVKRLFADCNRKLDYICENGAQIILQDETIAVTKMDRKKVEELVPYLRQFYSKGCELLVSAPNISYVESKNEEYISLIRDVIQNNVEVVDDVLAVDADIIKVSIYKKPSIRDLGKSELIPAWENVFKSTLAGEDWFDYMDKSVDKGNALKKLQEILGVSKDETMTFGDNNNDLGLILGAGESYVVETGVPEVKAAAKYICDGYDKLGVYNVLKERFKA